MLAIRYTKSIPRYLMVRSLTPYWTEIGTGNFSLIQLTDIPEPPLPGADWVRIRPRLSGICGSDLATIQAQGSVYFSPFVSCPFVFGHEVVGDVTEVGAAVEGIQIGDRVTIEPALGCQVRGISPACPMCAQGNYANCENITRGHIAPGMQTGYCQSTGGGWSHALVAHQSQVHRVPESLSDEEAVLIEPFSCAIHAVLKADLQADQTVLVLGCGAIGVLTLAAIRALEFQGRVVAIAKYPHQGDIAQTLGADSVLYAGSELYPQMRDVLNTQAFQPELGKPVFTGGADCTFDCVTSSTTLDDALRFTRPHGKVVLVGMPAVPRGVDWTSIWFKQLQAIGAYAYGIETYRGERIRTFTLAMQLMQQLQGQLRCLITGCYKLQDYRAALNAAMHPSRSKAIKTLFDLREDLPS